MKKLLVIIVLGLFTSTNSFSYTMNKKEFGDYCIDFTNESFDEQKIPRLGPDYHQVDCTNGYEYSVDDNSRNSFYLSALVHSFASYLIFLWYCI